MADDATTANPSGTKDEKLLKEARDRFKDCQESDETNRKDALDDLRFRVGEQWPEDIQRERQTKRRPCLTINRMPQFIRQVTGDIRQNKPAIKVLPVEDGDKDLAETYTGIIRHIEQASNADSAYINAAEGAASCGMGWFRITTEYSDDDGFDQEIRIKRGKNHFAYYCDPAAQEQDRSDAMYAFVTDLIPLEEFKRQFPDANTKDFETNQATSNGGSTRDTNWFDGKFVRVAEYWIKKPVTKNLALFEGGKVLDVTGMKAEDILALQPKRQRLVSSHKVCMYLISGSEVLEGPQEWAGKYIPIIPVLGEEVTLGDRTVRHGLIRYAKDPQRMFNYMRSASAEAIALQPKAPWVVTKEEIRGNEGMWNNAHIDNKPYLIFTPDPKAPGSRPQRTEPPNPPTALWAESTNAAEDMHATTGIYPAAIGAKSNEVSGKAILARQRESDTGTFAYVDNLAAAIAYCGRQLVDLIPKIYDTERSIRILGEDGTHKFVEINKTLIGPDGPKIVNDLTAGKYDVVVTTGPSYTTKRAEAAESMMAFVQANPQAAALISDLIAKNMDWPGADQMAERLKKALPPGIAEPEEGEEQAPPPPPDPIQLMAAAGDKAMAEAKVMSGAAAKAKAELEMAQVNAMTGMGGMADPGALAAQIIEQMRAEIMQLVQGDNDQTRAQVQAMTVALEAMLAYANAPKVIQRDATGRPVAVQAMMNGGGDLNTGVAQLGMPKQIATDQAGRPTGMH